MEKITIKPSYYKNFKCTTSNCICTCCSIWNIFIDDKTYNKYKSLKDKDFCKYIESNLTIPHHQIKLKHNLCPFLNENKMCKIQIKYGEEYLGETCRSFPREEHKYNNITKQNLLLSCPEVFKLVNNAKTFKNDINICEVNLKDNNSLSNKKTNKEHDLDINTINYLLNQIYSIKLLKLNNNKKLFYLFYFLKDLDLYLEKNLLDNNLCDYFNKDYFTNLKQIIKKKYLTKYKDFISIFAEMSHSVNNYFNVTFNNQYIKQNIKNVKSFDFSNCKQSTYKKFLKTFNKNINVVNILIYFLDLNFVDNLKNKTFLADFKLGLHAIIFNMTLLFTLYLQKQLSKDSFILVFCNSFRAYYHNADFNSQKRLLNNNAPNIIQKYLDLISIL